MSAGKGRDPFDWIIHVIFWAVMASMTFSAGLTLVQCEPPDDDGWRRGGGRSSLCASSGEFSMSGEICG